MDSAELWDCLEASWVGEGEWEVVNFDELLKEDGFGEGCWERADPVLGPVPPGFIDRSTFAFIELDKKYDVLKGRPSLNWFGDLAGGAGGWVEGLCYSANNTHNLTGLSGVGMSCSRSKLDESNTARFLPKEFYFTGADTTGDPREASNIKAFSSTISQRTSSRGLDILLAAEPAGGTILRTHRAYTTSRVLISLMTLSQGGSLLINLPDITSPFAHSVLYILRLTFEKIILTWPRILRPTETPSAIIVCLKKVDPPRLTPAVQSDVLISYLSKAATAMSGPSGETIHSLVSKTAMEEKTFKTWLEQEITALLTARTMLLREARSGTPTPESTQKTVVTQFYEEIGLSRGTVLPASQFLPSTPGKRAAFSNMSYYPPAKK